MPNNADSGSTLFSIVIGTLTEEEEEEEEDDRSFAEVRTMSTNVPAVSTIIDTTQISSCATRSCINVCCALGCARNNSFKDDDDDDIQFWNAYIFFVVRRDAKSSQKMMFDFNEPCFSVRRCL